MRIIIEGYRLGPQLLACCEPDEYLIGRTTGVSARLISFIKGQKQKKLRAFAGFLKNNSKKLFDQKQAPATDFILYSTLAKQNQ